MSQQQAVYPIGRFGQQPPEGFAAIPLIFTFDGGATKPVLQPFSLVLSQATGGFTQARSVFIDNSASSAPTVLQWNSGQLIEVAAYSQGYYPVLAPGDLNGQVLSSAGQAGTIIQVTIFLVNILLPAVTWSVRGLPSSPTQNGSGDSSLPNFRANFSHVNDITATDSNIITGIPGYWIQGFDAYISTNASLAVAGDLIVSLVDSSAVVLWKGRIALPAVPAVPNYPTVNHLSVPNNFLWTSKTANTTLSVVLSSPLVTGQISYSLNYGLTAFVG